MSDDSLNSSKDVLVDFPDMRKKQFGRKTSKRYHLYQEIEEGKSMWNENSFMYKRIQGEA